MIDLEKRKRIMARSVMLGHCICNPKRSCPCDVFKEKDVCPCAGERVENAVEEVRLTSLVEKAGCASKINQNDLKLVLAGLPEVIDPNVLVGTNTCDDAGVYEIDKNTALVQTVDVFTPSVDDPYTFGQVAAANSLSDVYAMGGKPLTALSIIGFPIETISPRVMTQILRGGMDKMREAGVVIIGGHSINDQDPKFGYAVTGVVNPNRVIANNTAKPGDVLILTKPLGVGIISFAGQMGRASESALAAAAKSMTELNKAASEAMIEVGVSAATDVTGFGLLGHLGEMVRQSGVTAELWADSIPVFDEVLDYVSQAMISGGIERNIEHSAQFVSVEEGVGEEMTYVLYDPQTSGGMLISVSEEKAGALVSRLNERGTACAQIIGRIVGKSNGEITVRRSAQSFACVIPSVVEESAFSLPDSPLTKEEPMSNDTNCCCSDSQTNSSPAELFSEFVGANLTDGAISLRAKELMAISLSLVTKCEPCVKIHIDKAKKMGITDAEIDECAMLAVMFGGAPVMMLYNNIKSQVES